MYDIDCAVGATPCLTADDDHGFLIDEAEVVHWGLCPARQPDLTELVSLAVHRRNPYGDTNV